MADWDERYRAGENTDTEPSPLLARFASAAPPGRALDLACGAGRNATYLASLGWRVIATDRSAVAISILKDRAAVYAGSLSAVVADLEDCRFAIEPASFDLICDFFYLQRDLFPKIRGAFARVACLLLRFTCSTTSRMPGPGTPRSCCDRVNCGPSLRIGTCCTIWRARGRGTGGESLSSWRGEDCDSSGSVGRGSSAARREFHGNPVRARA